jgi:hypothetical protein
VSAFASLCFAIWCAFGPSELNGVYPPPVSLAFGREVVSIAETLDNFLLIEQYHTFGGVTIDNVDRVHAIAGYFPLRLQLGPVRFDGGASLATGAVPKRGTYANWVAALTVKIAGPLHLKYWHMSNGGGGAQNPSIDALLLTFKWTPGSPKGSGYEPKPLR